MEHSLYIEFGTGLSRSVVILHLLGLPGGLSQTLALQYFCYRSIMVLISDSGIYRLFLVHYLISNPNLFPLTS